MLVMVFQCCHEKQFAEIFTLTGVQYDVRLPAFAFDPTRAANVYNGNMICTASKLKTDDPRTIKYDPLPDGTMPPPKEIRRYQHGEIVPDDVPDSPSILTFENVPSRPNQGDSIDGSMHSPDGYVEDETSKYIALCVAKYNPEHNAEHDAEHDAELITEHETKLMTKIKAMLKKELKKELMAELKKELMAELKKELKVELKKEHKVELKAELKKKIQRELNKELTPEHDPEHDAAVQPEFQPPEPTEEFFEQPAPDPMQW